MFFIVMSACSKKYIELTYVEFFNKYKNFEISGFRLPQGDDMSYWGTDKNTYLYKTTDDQGITKEPYWTKGDFNNDGIVDRAYIVFNKNDASAEVFSFVSIDTNSFMIMKISSAAKMMGISTVVKNKNEFNIKLFAFEGHANQYKWNNKKKGFVINN